MPSMYQFSFANTDLVLAVPNPLGVYKRFKVKGFPVGEQLINVTRRAPVATTSFSAYGDFIINLQRIRATDLVFPLIMNAPENKILQDYVNYVQAQADGNGDNIYPVHGKLTDNMGNDEVTLKNGVILAIPGMTRGQSMSTISWVITFGEGVFSRGDGVDAASLGV